MANNTKLAKSGLDGEIADAPFTFCPVRFDAEDPPHICTFLK